MTTDTVGKIIFLVLGWLLGLLSTVINEAIKRGRERREAEAAIRVELMEVQFRLLGAVFQIATRMARVDRNLLGWMRPIVERYEGLHPTDALVQGYKALEGLTDAQLAALAQQSHPGTGFGLSLKKYATPMLDSKLSILSALRPESQNLILEVKAVLNLLNEEIDYFRFFFNLTFNVNQSEENRSALDTNMHSSYDSVFNGARRAIDLIGRFLAR